MPWIELLASSVSVKECPAGWSSTITADNIPVYVLVVLVLIITVYREPETTFQFTFWDRVSELAYLNIQQVLYAFTYVLFLLQHPCTCTLVPHPIYVSMGVKLLVRFISVCMPSFSVCRQTASFRSSCSSCTTMSGTLMASWRR